MKVMKFGGTSVADQAAIERLIALVRAERQAEAQTEGGDARGPVVVVSALSGVTDRLLGVAALAGSGDVEGARTSLQDLRARHIKVSEVITRAVAAPAGRRCAQPRVRRARARRHRAGGAAGSVAALARCARRDRRDSQQPDRRGGADVAQAAGDLRRFAQGRRHRRRAHGGRAAVRGNDRGVDDACGSAAGRRPHSRDGRVRRRDAERRDHDAGPRRFGFLGGDRRRVPGRVGDPDLDRRRRHAHRRSAHRQESAGRAALCRSPKRPSWPTSARRSCIRRPFSRRSRATFPCASSTRIARPRAAR